MMWNGYGGGWGMAVMMLSQLLFWGLIIIGAIYLVRTVNNKHGNPGSAYTAEQILTERYARGEIDDEEYRRRLGGLRHG